MPNVSLTASDGHVLSAYRADPTKTQRGTRGAIVVIQEIFGVNSHIRAVCDRLAALGYVAIAPAIFDRTERNFESGYTAQEIEKARAFIRDPHWDSFILDTDAARAGVADVGKVGIVGFCLGGSVAFLAASRLEGLSAASGYYGGRIANFADEKPRCPTQLHYGSRDQGIPMSNVDCVRAQLPDCDVYVYEGAEHGFNCDQRASYHKQAAGEAWARTLKIFSENIG